MLGQKLVGKIPFPCRGEAGRAFYRASFPANATTHRHERCARTVVLISHEVTLPRELEHFCARFQLAFPTPEERRFIVEKVATEWTKTYGGKVKTDRKSFDLLVENLAGLSTGDTERLARKVIFDDGALLPSDLPAVMQAKYDLLNRAVEIIRDRFAFYHVQVFLIDDSRDYAYLQASTGEIGEQLLARGHRLRLDSNSVIGRVSLAGEPIIARDSDSGHAFNELLPDTRSELAIPIKDSDGIIGSLDVQSRLSNAFTANEIRVLNVIANQLATAIRNARLFENQAHSLRENKRLFIESETNLREIQRLNRQLTRQAWTDYLKMDRRITGVTLEGQGFSNKADWTPEMMESGQRRRPIKGNMEGQRKVAVPIELRGEVVGAIEIELPKIDDEESTIDMIQAISQRLAVSLDNARLFEETQEATAQEQRVGELVSRYQSANTVDDLLQITLEGLIETLGADAGSIRLGRLPELDIAPDAEPNGHSQNGGA